MKNLNKKTLIWLLFYVLVFSFLLYNSFNYFDNDFGWHIRVGEQIVREKNAPHLEYYNYTLSGQKWVDHEWLFNLIIYFIYHNFGYIFVNALFALLVITILFILNRFVQKYFLANNNIFLLMLLEFFGVLAMSPHLGVRMQEIAILNVLLLLITLEKFRRHRSMAILWWLPLLFLIWANLHGSFLIGLVILIFWVIINSSELIWRKYAKPYFLNASWPLDLKQIQSVLLFSFLSFGATLITPYGLKLYNFLKDYNNNFYLLRISEWTPFYYLPIQYKQLGYAAIIATALIMLLLFALKMFSSGPKQITAENYQIDLWYFCLTLFFIVIAFKSKRNFPLLFIASFPLIINVYSQILTLPPQFSKILQKNTILNFFMIVAVLLLTASYISKIKFTNEPFASPLFCRRYPCQAVNFIRSQDQYRNLKMLNHYDWGGWLLWVWPEKPIFIDGRMPQYKIKNYSLLEEYYSFWDKDKVKSKLDEYQIKMVLIQLPVKIKLNWLEKYFLGLDEAKVNDNDDELKNHLIKSPDWHKIYADDLSRVYVKN